MVNISRIACRKCCYLRLTKKTKLFKLHRTAVFLVFICTSNTMAIYVMCDVVKSSLWIQDGRMTFPLPLWTPKLGGMLIFLWPIGQICKICKDIFKRKIKIHEFLWALQLCLRVPKTKMLWQNRKIFFKCLNSLANVWSSLIAFEKDVSYMQIADSSFSFCKFSPGYLTQI